MLGGGERRFGHGRAIGRRQDRVSSHRDGLDGDGVGLRVAVRLTCDGIRERSQKLRLPSSVTVERANCRPALRVGSVVADVLDEQPGECAHAQSGSLQRLRWD